MDDGVAGHHGVLVRAPHNQEQEVVLIQLQKIEGIHVVEVVLIHKVVIVQLQ